jgi:predicted XRE-type DNA-binding protein
VAKHGNKPGPVVGSGDFLQDRGYQDPEEMRLKFALANEVALIVAERNLKQADVARIAEISQSDVSRIVNGVVKDYSVYRLMRVVTKLGRNVLIDFRDSGKAHGAILAAEEGVEYVAGSARTTKVRK